MRLLRGFRRWIMICKEHCLLIPEIDRMRDVNYLKPSFPH